MGEAAAMRGGRGEGGGVLVRAGHKTAGGGEEGRPKGVGEQAVPALTYAYCLPACLCFPPEVRNPPLTWTRQRLVCSSGSGSCSSMVRAVSHRTAPHHTASSVVQVPLLEASTHFRSCSYKKQLSHFLAGCF